MLKKTLAAAFFVLLLNSFTFGFQRSPPWQMFNSPEGKFNILAPSKPKLKVEDIDSPPGKVTYYSYSSVSNVGFFSITYFDHPVEAKNASEINSRLDVIRDGVLSTLGGEVVSEKKMRLYGYPGREFFVKKSEKGSDDLYQWRIFLVGKRVYQLAVATERKDSGSPDIAKFFTSFNLN